MPTSSAPGSADSSRTWLRPMAPVPKTPTRKDEPALLRLASPAPAAPRHGPVNPPLAALDEGDEVVHVRIARQLGPEPLQGLGRVQLLAHQDAVGELQPAHVLGVEALALEADGVQAVAGRLLPHGLDERQHVHRGHGVAPHVGVPAHPAELVDGAEGADVGVVVHLDVPGQGGAVGEDDAAPHLAVVPDVSVGHEQAVAPHPGDAAALGRAAVDGAELPEDVAVADLQPDVLALELQVLGIETDGGLGIDAVLAADAGGAVDLRPSSDLRAGTDLDAGADHRERSDA